MFKRFAKLPFYPGPVSLFPEVAGVFQTDYGPPRSSPQFGEDYRLACKNLQVLMGTSSEVVLLTGEGMLGLWSALKCTLEPGDTMVSVGTGVFGDGFGDMAAGMGCVVEKVSLPYDSTITPEALERVDDAIRRLKPVMITAVHCETPSGTLNPLAELGRLKRDRGVPLFVVDAVASLGGAPVPADAWNVDLLLGGSQKCLSCPADMAILGVSAAAWERIAEINHQGYEALLPFRGAGEDPMRLPYTPHWPGVAALKIASGLLLEQGLDAVFARHEKVARQCRDGLAALNIALWPAPEAVSSPTVTAARIPYGFTWPQWRDKLAKEGLVVGGSLGPMSGKVFRLGHMGAQADSLRMSRALKVIARAMGR